MSVYIMLLIIFCYLLAAMRSRDLGIPFDGDTGQWNTIVDVPGVAVGNYTCIDEEKEIFTGVTAILPTGVNVHSCFCAVSSYNGNGEVAGLAWLDESGLLETPILLTNTHSVGLVRDSAIKWMSSTQKSPSANAWGLPVVLETYDGDMNSSLFHIKPENVYSALNDAISDGHVPLGSVGGGTGNIAYDFKAGCGSSSRKTPQGYTVGVWCQVNIGLRHEFNIRGMPIGRKVTNNTVRYQGAGSLVVIIATDAPLMPLQLKRLAHRCALGMARTGTISHNGSGDIFLAFSTANTTSLYAAQSDGFDKARAYKFLPTGRCLDPLFRAVVQATEEAIVDSIIVQRESHYKAKGKIIPVLSHNVISDSLITYKSLVDDLQN